jgi:hypothetical protein
LRLSHLSRAQNEALSALAFNPVHSRFGLSRPASHSAASPSQAVAKVQPDKLSMKKTFLTSHFARPSNRTRHNMAENCRRLPKEDLYFYAQAVHKAAKKLAGALKLDVSPFSELTFTRSCSCTGTLLNFS